MQAKSITLNTDDWYKAMDEKRVFNGVDDVTIERCGDIHPSFYPMFPDAKTVTMRGCDKNFVFYWLQEHVFPNMQTIYLNSHPCEPVVLARFPNAMFYLSTRYETYKNRWASKRDNVILMDMPF